MDKPKWSEFSTEQKLEVVRRDQTMLSREAILLFSLLGSLFSSLISKMGLLIGFVIITIVALASYIRAAKAKFFTLMSAKPGSFGNLGAFAKGYLSKEETKEEDKKHNEGGANEFKK